MINVFDYFHYKLHNYSLWVFSKSMATADSNAIASVIISLNITSLLMVIFNVDFEWTLVIFTVLLMIIFSNIYNDERHEKLTERYSHESHKQKLIGRFAVIAYVIASIVSAGIVLWHSFD